MFLCHRRIRQSHGLSACSLRHASTFRMILTGTWHQASPVSVECRTRSSEDLGAFQVLLRTRWSGLCMFWVPCGCESKMAPAVASKAPLKGTQAKHFKPSKQLAVAGSAFAAPARSKQAHHRARKMRGASSYVTHQLQHPYHGVRRLQDHACLGSLVDLPLALVGWLGPVSSC